MIKWLLCIHIVKTCIHINTYVSDCKKQFGHLKHCIFIEIILSFSGETSTNDGNHNCWAADGIFRLVLKNGWFYIFFK
jgi:hypothetical protein